MLNFRGSVYFRNWISYSLPLLGGSILIVNPGSVLIINQQLLQIRLISGVVQRVQSVLEEIYNIKNRYY